jgi:hypothetical protein
MALITAAPCTVKVLSSPALMRSKMLPPPECAAD